MTPHCVEEFSDGDLILRSESDNATTVEHSGINAQLIAPLCMSKLRVPMEILIWIVLYVVPLKAPAIFYTDTNSDFPHTSSNTNIHNFLLALPILWGIVLAVIRHRRMLDANRTDAEVWHDMRAYRCRSALLPLRALDLVDLEFNTVVEEDSERMERRVHKARKDADIAWDALIHCIDTTDLWQSGRLAPSTTNAMTEFISKRPSAPARRTSPQRQLSYIRQRSLLHQPRSKKPLVRVRSPWPLHCSSPGSKRIREMRELSVKSISTSS